MNKEQDQDAEIARLIWFLISPISFFIHASSERQVLRSERWTKLRIRRTRYIKASLLLIPIGLIFYLLSFKTLSENINIGIALFYLASLTHYPLARLAQINQFNKSLKKLAKGTLEPDKSYQLRKAKFEHEVDFARYRYKELFTAEQLIPKDAIGIRVNPIPTAMPLQGSTKISPDELGAVANDDFALFPLNESSPSHHLLIGATGSGKTTLILKIIESALSRNWKVVVLDLKGDTRDVPRFLNLASGEKKVVHFPSQNLQFWEGSKDEVTERLISMIPVNSQPFYMTRNIAAIKAVVSRSELPVPKSSSELISRLRLPKDATSDPNDFKFLTTKERGISIGEQVANDFTSYLQPIMMAEQSSKSSFSWNSDWDLALFTLDSFQPSWLQLGKVILNDFSLWMLSQTRLKSLRPTLLIIDEASALTRDGTPPVLPALLQRARSAQVSLVLASQTYTAFGDSTNEVINSGAIRWLGSSSKVEEMISATGTTSITESGHQQVDGRYSGVISHREQKQFLIDPDLVRTLPSFHWLVSERQKVSHLYVPNSV
jgi:hypothetical protein